ncbi:MAG TPA: prepilin-type N-terminal cleavage/methylation domain-containing protein [Bacteroidia bacterium]|nr:prepilin-type N-terminal cleavage/methylation domain-containing protein [Bacteroidia bacterium]HNU34417.1 prepilin-type N-terminal cleavage/methylation domain-containing protein [Bacteroidia bacterium]
MRLKGFTIIELTIAMLLSALVVSAVYFGFVSIQKLVNRIKSFTQTNTSLNVLSNRIQTDFVESSSIILKENQLVFHTNSEETNYLINDTACARTSGSSIDFYSCKLKIENTEFVSSTELLRECNLILLNQSDTFTLTLQKEFTPEEIFNAHTFDR